jgi:hypothetical protein
MGCDFSTPSPPAAPGSLQTLCFFCSFHEFSITYKLPRSYHRFSAPFFSNPCVFAVRVPPFLVFSLGTFGRSDLRTFPRVFDLSPFSSRSCALFCATGAMQLFWNQFVAHSFYCDGGVCTPEPTFWRHAIDSQPKPAYRSAPMRSRIQLS